MKLISVIVPTLDRPEKLAACLESLAETTPAEGYELLVYPEADSTAVIKWNKGAAEARGDWLLLGADDYIFHPGWYEAVQANDHTGFIGLNDCSFERFEPFEPPFSALFMASREFLMAHMGGVLAIPHYTSWWLDREATERARKAGRYIWVREARVEHLHPDWGKSAMDSTYWKGKEFHEADRILYEQRRAAGHPDDFEPVIVPIEEVDYVG